MLYPPFLRLTLVYNSSCYHFCVPANLVALQEERGVKARPFFLSLTHSRLFSIHNDEEEKKERKFDSSSSMLDPFDGKEAEQI